MDDGWNPMEVARALNSGNDKPTFSREDDELREISAAFGEDTDTHGNSIFTAEKGMLICDLVASGLSMKQICRHPLLPNHRGTIYHWLHRNSEFAEKYRIAQAAKMEAYVDDMVEIADDCSDDIEWGKDGPKIKGSAIRRAQVQIDTRKWIVARLAGHKYGDKTTMEHIGEGSSGGGKTEINITLLPSGTVIEKEEQESGVTIDLQAEKVVA